MFTALPLMVISKKRFLKRCCISVISHHDLAVIVIYPSQSYSTGGGGHTAKQKKLL